LLNAEAHLIEANRQRVKTESQKDAEAAALLRIETELAKERQKQGRTNLADPSDAGRAVDKVAAATNESADTVRKRAAIHAAGVDPVERNQQSTSRAFNNVNGIPYPPKSKKPIPCACACPECGEQQPSKSQLREHGKNVHAVPSEKISEFLRRANLPVESQEPAVEPETPSQAADSTSSLPLQDSEIQATEKIPMIESVPEHLRLVRGLRQWIKMNAPIFSKRVVVSPCGFGYGSGLGREQVLAGEKIATAFDLQLRNLRAEQVQVVIRCLEATESAVTPKVAGA